METESSTPGPTEDNEVHIMNFPDEILLKILKLLSPMDRRVLSLCGKRFLRLWLDKIFQGDRKIVIYGCLLEDPEKKPWKTLLDSDRIITDLVLVDVNFHEVDESLLDELWEKLGKTVTNLEFQYYWIFDREWPSKKFWKYFSDVKSLALSLEDGDQYTEDLPPKLEKIVLHAVSSAVLSLKVGKLFKNYLKTKNPDKLSIEDDIGIPDNAYEPLKECAAYFTKLSLTYDAMISNDSIFKNLKHLKLDCSNYNESNLFELIEAKCPSINYLKLYVCNKFPTKNVPYLKKMIIENPTNEAQLKKFENLEELIFIIENNNNECFFDHKSFLNTNMVKFEIEYSSSIRLKPCIECFTSMAISYPNLKTLSLPNATNTHLKIIQMHLPLLMKLNMNINLEPQHIDKLDLNYILNLTELQLTGVGINALNLNKNIPLMKHLRSLTIDNVDTSFAKSFFKDTPILESLHILIDEKDKDDVKDIVMLILQNVKRLSVLGLEIDFKCSEINNICKLIANYYPFMKNLIVNECVDYQTIIFKNSQIYSWARN